METFILASESPRRRELLEAAGYRFEVMPSGVVEPEPTGFPSARAYVAHVAWLKADAVASEASQWVLAADTAVEFGDKILGKPVDRSDAERILRALEGTRHRVLTGVCLARGGADLFVSLVAETLVTMRRLSDSGRAAYLDSRRWEGKAGAYGIQDEGDPFVEAVEGSFTNVMGLPMERLEDLFHMARMAARRSTA